MSVDILSVDASVDVSVDISIDISIDVSIDVSILDTSNLLMLFFMSILMLVTDESISADIGEDS